MTNFWIPTSYVDQILMYKPTNEFSQEFCRLMRFLSQLNSYDIVCDKYINNLTKVITAPEAKFFLSHQLFLQNFHFEAFSTINEKINESYPIDTNILDLNISLNSDFLKQNFDSTFQANSLSEQIVISICLTTIANFTIHNANIIFHHDIEQNFLFGDFSKK